MTTMMTPDKASGSSGWFLSDPSLYYNPDAVLILSSSVPTGQTYSDLPQDLEKKTL